MSRRPILDPSRIAPAAAAKMGSAHVETLDEIEAAIAEHAVVVVGMAQNPHVRNVRRALKDAGIEVHTLAYGSYFSEWSRRLAIKQWSGWPTFPQVFVKGVLIGGEDLTKAALADGSLQARLEGSKATSAAVNTANGSELLA